MARTNSEVGSTYGVRISRYPRRSIDPTEGTFNGVPPADLRRQDVVHALDGFDERRAHGGPAYRRCGATGQELLLFSCICRSRACGLFQRGAAGAGVGRNLGQSYNPRLVGQDSSDNPKKKPRKAVCALDLGAVRVGVAITDELGLMAHPRGVLAAKPRPALLAALKELVAEENIGRIIVGFPLDMRGTEGEAARRARDTCTGDRRRDVVRRRALRRAAHDRAGAARPHRQRPQGERRPAPTSTRRRPSRSCRPGSTPGPRSGAPRAASRVRGGVELRMSRAVWRRARCQQAIVVAALARGRRRSRPPRARATSSGGKGERRVRRQAGPADPGPEGKGSALFWIARLVRWALPSRPSRRGSSCCIRRAPALGRARTSRSRSTATSAQASIIEKLDRAGLLRSPRAFATLLAARRPARNAGCSPSPTTRARTSSCAASSARATPATPR